MMIVQNINHHTSKIKYLIFKRILNYIQVLINHSKLKWYKYSFTHLKRRLDYTQQK